MFEEWQQLKIVEMDELDMQKIQYSGLNYPLDLIYRLYKIQKQAHPDIKFDDVINLKHITMQLLQSEQYSNFKQIQDDTAKACIKRLVRNNKFESVGC